ncbi:hypothetical protein [Variovorax paradoxus]|uniref:hypothetical protein n=1 Tax=Variovorax paradoxus TaxID=34073 RepID=UPI003D655F83
MKPSVVSPAAQQYEGIFRGWVADSLAAAIPPAVRAFAFNILEYAETPSVEFAIEFVGTGSFDEDDADWACDEVWEPYSRRLEIPPSFSGLTWQECLDRMESLLAACLESPSLGPKLRQGVAVGIGFVDGDLTVAWQR